MAGNWNPAAVPGAATDVQIDTITPDLMVIGQAGAQALGISIGSATGEVGNLTVTGSGSTLAVGNGFFFIGDFGQGTFTWSNCGVARKPPGQSTWPPIPYSSGTVLINRYRLPVQRQWRVGRGVDNKPPSARCVRNSAADG